MSCPCSHKGCIPCFHSPSMPHFKKIWLFCSSSTSASLREVLAWTQLRPSLPKSRRFLILLYSDLICRVLTVVWVSQREGENQSCPYFCSFMRSCMQMTPRSISCTGFPFTSGWLYVVHTNAVSLLSGCCFWSTNWKAGCLLFSLSEEIPLQRASRCQLLPSLLFLLVLVSFV